MHGNTFERRRESLDLDHSKIGKLGESVHFGHLDYFGLDFGMFDFLNFENFLNTDNIDYMNLENNHPFVGMFF